MYKYEHKVSKGRFFQHRARSVRPLVFYRLLRKHVLKHRSIITPVCSPLTRFRQVESLYSSNPTIYFHRKSFSLDDEPSSQSCDASATCWSSPFCFCSLWHHLSCLSVDFVPLVFPASLSCSACWCKCWVPPSGSGSCNSGEERQREKCSWGQRTAGRRETSEDSCYVITVLWENVVTWHHHCVCSSSDYLIQYFAFKISKTVTNIYHTSSDNEPVENEPRLLVLNWMINNLLFIHDWIPSFSWHCSSFILLFLPLFFILTLPGNLESRGCQS